MRNKYISQSAIKDFISCNKRYYYRVNFPEEAEKTYQMSLGNVVHYLLEMYSQDQEEAFDNIQKASVRFGLDKSFEDNVKDLLSNYFTKFKTLTTPSDLLEYKFTVPYDAENGIFITGKFDRINKTNNLVMDWKTGKLPYNGLTSDIQSIIYYQSYKQLFGFHPTLVCVGLRESKLMTYVPEQMYIDIIYSELIPDMVSAIQRREYPHQGLYNNSCKNCSYREICFRELGAKNKNE